VQRRLRVLTSWTVILAVLVIGVSAGAALAGPPPDPAGTATGNASTVYDAQGTPFMATAPTDASAPDYAERMQAYDEFQAQRAREPLAMKLADAVGHGRLGMNFGWTLSTGFIVLFMQVGFALLTTGLVRKKNAGHVMMLNFSAYVCAFLAYYAVGYAFQFGAVAVNAAPHNLGGAPTLNAFLIGDGRWGFVGGKGFFLSGPAYDVGANALMLFEVVFMETAGYIIVGAICERITFGAFVLCELFVGAILYPIFGCWVWGGGWLSQLGTSAGLGHGYCDFAGSTVVHTVGGFCAMALAVILGPRAGKYSGGRPRAFRAHNVPFVVAGTLILLFGWMGFNAGSTLGATDLRISVIAVNTNLAAVAGGATAMVFWSLRFGKPDISMACTGMLGGLVAITASSAFVGPNSAVIIGILAGIVVCVGVLFNERVVRIDDPCGVIAVHGYCGWLGAVCLGLFADGTYGTGWNGVGVATYLGTAGRGVTGLFHGDKSQFYCQLIGATVCTLWAFGATFLVFKTVDAVNPMRVSAEAEFNGLDEPEFGSLAYPEDARST
jgi:ammonium transporter, Amt family